MPRYNTRYAVTIESAEQRKSGSLQRHGFIVYEPTADDLRREMLISKMRKCEVDRVRYNAHERATANNEYKN